MIAWILASVNRDPKKPPPELADFMYRDPESATIEKERQTLDWLRARKRHVNGG